MPRQARRLMRQGVADLLTRAHVDAYTGPNGEVISDGDTLRLQDGSTPGGIPLARSKFRQAGSDFDSTLADEAVSRFHTGQFRTNRDGTARVEAALLRQFREARPYGRRFDLLAGTYLVSGLEFDWRGLAGDFPADRRGVPIQGEGSQNTIIRSAVGGQFAISHVGPALLYSGMSDQSVVGAVPEANGVDLFGLAYFPMRRMNFGKLNVALRMESMLSGHLDELMFSDVQIGAEILPPTKTGAYTDFNMMRWTSPHFKQCHQWAMKGGPSSTIPMFAPVIEGNGTMSRGPQGEAIYDPANDTGAMKLTFTGGNGHVGLVMFAPYIEANLGKCDIELINTSDRPIVHVLIAPYFGRLDGATYTQNNLILTGKHKVIIIGGVHEHHHNYVPSADRSYIKYNPAESKVVNIGTTWESDIEKGDLFNIEDKVAELTAKKEALIRVTAAGVASGLPSGWFMTKGGTGLYTLTHNLGRSDYVVLALATTGLNVRVDHSFTNDSIVAFTLLDTTNNLADAAFNAVVKY